MSSEPDEVTVLEVADPVQQSLIESVLTDAEVPYMVRHVGVQNLIGAGTLGGHNFLTGPIVIQVMREDAERARELIAAALNVPELPAED
ncbi:MAG TPA: DUF2007 domain-containing protein [Candidatus Eisenbacteria bacterium]